MHVYQQRMETEDKHGKAQQPEICTDTFQHAYFDDKIQGRGSGNRHYQE